METVLFGVNLAIGFSFGCVIAAAIVVSILVVLVFFTYAVEMVVRALFLSLKWFVKKLLKTK